MERKKAAIIALIVSSIIYLPFIIFTLIRENTTIEEVEEIKTERTIEEVHLGRDVYLLNFEGHEYLTRSRGSIVHSESCNCKGVE